MDNTVYIRNKEDGAAGVRSLITRFYDELIRLSDQAYDLNQTKHKSIYDQLKAHKRYYKNKLKSKKLTQAKRRLYNSCLSRARRLYRKFDRRNRQLKAIGFNSSSYDLHLIVPTICEVLNERHPFVLRTGGRRPGAPPAAAAASLDDDDDDEEDQRGLSDVDDTSDLYLTDDSDSDADSECDDEERFKFAICKTSSKYTTWSTTKLQFLDAREWIGPGTNLREFLRCFGQDSTDQKLFFPYETVTQLSDLDRSGFPVYESFWSCLNGENTLDEGVSEEHGRANHERMARLYEEKGCRDLGDWLRLYQCYDVRPFYNAVVRLIEMYAELGIPLLNYLTLPSLAYDYAIRQTDGAFYCIPEHMKQWYFLLQSQITGGFASCLSQPRAVAGETLIDPERFGERALPVRSIQCLDFNSLYPAIMMERLPCGMPRIRYADAGFALVTGETHLQNSAKGIQYARWLSFTTGSTEIAHAGNGREVVINNRYRVDAFDFKTGRAYDFHGCYYHFCPKCYPARRLATDAERRDARRRRADDLEKEDFMRENDVEYTVMWECRFDRLATEERDLWEEFEGGEGNRLADCAAPEFRSCFDDGGGGGEIDREVVLKKVKDGDFFGFLLVDVRIKPEYRNHYDMYPIIIARHSIDPAVHLSAQQRETAAGVANGMKSTSAVVGCYEADRYLVISEHVRFWMSLVNEDEPEVGAGLGDPHVEITHVHQIVEYDGRPVLRTCMGTLASLRRAGDRDPSQKMKGTLAKLVANSVYGRSLLRRDLFTQYRIVNRDDLRHLTQLPEYRTSSPLLKPDEVLRRQAEDIPLFVDDGRDPNALFQVNLAHKTIVADCPIALGSYILSAAKLRNMRAVQILKKFLRRGWYNLGYTDTDSLFFLLAAATIDECVREGLEHEWFSEVRDKWFVREYCRAHKDEYVSAKTNRRPWTMDECCRREHAYYLREPGLLKVEYTATKLEALSAKTYILESADGTHKMSHKGVQKSASKQWNFDTFRNVRETGECLSATNRGFQPRGSVMYTYEQRKTGLNPLDKKRFHVADYPGTTKCFSSSRAASDDDDMDTDDGRQTTQN